MSKRKRKKEKRSTAETAKRRAEQHQVGYENMALNIPADVTVFRLKSDKAVRLDILPYPVGEGNPYADEGQLHYERTFWVHRGIGVDGASFICRRKTVGEKCPICDHRAKLLKDEDADEDLIKDLAPKERQLFNVIDTKDRDKGVQIFEVSFHLFGKQLDARIRNADEDDGYENFAELEGGFTLKCGVEEKSFGGRSFYAIETIDFKQRKDDYDEDILEGVHTLDDLLRVFDYDELKAIFLQTAGDDDDDKEKSKSTKSEEKDDDDDGFDDDDIEVDSEVVFEDEDGDNVTGTVVSIGKKKVTVKTEDGDEVKVKMEDLSLASEDDDDGFDDDQNKDDDESKEDDDDDDDDGSENGVSLQGLTKDDDEDDFEEFSDEIEERCGRFDIDPDDFDTWKKTELAVRKKEAKKTSKKSTKKAKKSTKKSKKSKKGKK